MKALNKIRMWLFGYPHRTLIIFGIMGFSYGMGLQYPSGKGVALTWLGFLYTVTGCMCCFIWHTYHRQGPED